MCFSLTKGFTVLFPAKKIHSEAQRNKVKCPVFLWLWLTLFTRPSVGGSYNNGVHASFLNSPLSIFFPLLPGYKGRGDLSGSECNK